MGRKQIEIWDRRQACELTEQVPAGKFLGFAYAPLVYPWLSWLLYGRAVGSRFLGWLARRAFSRGRIGRFVREYNINLDECTRAEHEFSCFNDFFIRRLRPETRPWLKDDRRLAAPADCRASFFPALPASRPLPVKGVGFTVAELLESNSDQWLCLAGGPAMVARLAPVDCHRFYFPGSGRVVSQWTLPGRYDSVHPLALGRRPGILAANIRQVSLLELAYFGIVAMVEVGAFAVADIVQTHNREHFSKMDEKGYFNFGGSTIVLLLQPGVVTWDEDLQEQSGRGMETRLRFGEQIGVWAGASSSKSD